MTSDLTRFARQQLPGAVVSPLTRDRGSGSLLELRDEKGQTWYAKQLRRRARFDAEVDAYGHWGHLPFVSTIRAIDPATRCLLVRGLPGRPPRWDSTRVLRVAGSQLRRMHEVTPGTDWPDNWRRRARREASHHLEALRERSVRVPVRLVRGAVRELVALEGLPLAVTHGDYHPYNWRVRARNLYVFDFEQAAVRPAVHDFARLRYSVCWDRPRLFEALTAGYARGLTETECRYLELSLVVRAVVGLNLGLRRQRPVMVEHARTVFSHALRHQL